MQQLPTSLKMQKVKVLSLIILFIILFDTNQYEEEKFI